MLNNTLKPERERNKVYKKYWTIFEVNQIKWARPL
jgi:hypothetical protein